jgi:molybdopterin-dependent oxidoreductase alpha subunit
MQGPIPESLFRDTPLAELARLTSARLERLGRLAFPIIAGPGDSHFRRIGWQQALARVTGALRAADPQQVFFYLSGRSSNEGAFLSQLVARAYGTPHIHNCSYYCHSASSVALKQVYGSGTASVVLQDLDRTDLCLIAGANPASNHPRMISRLVHLRRRGGKVIVVNPLRELGLVRFRVPSDWRSLLFGSRIADIYLQPHVGSDQALFLALLKGVVERGGVDQAFVDRHTSGWPDVRQQAADADWDQLCGACGVDRGQIDRAVEALVGAESGVCMWAMGLTHHGHGVDNITALANLALARGWLGRPGCGLLPIRGHSNVQGVGSMGVVPTLSEAVALRLEQACGVTPPRSPGQHTMASMEAAAAGQVQAAVLLGGNLYASNPDLDWASAALGKIGLTFNLTTTLNLGHIHGRGRTTIIVPVLARDEEPHPTTQESMFNYVRLSEGGAPAVEGELRAEVQVMADLAEGILGGGPLDPDDLRSTDWLRRQIARVVPGYGAITRVQQQSPQGGEFQIGGRTFHAPRFSTPDGRARFSVTRLPDLTLGEGEFRLMTLRSEGQFNTVVYEEQDLYRGNTRRQVVMMNADDAARLGLAEGSPVRVQTEAGSLEVAAALVQIPPGNLAMYFPEANVLVPRRIDPRSMTPAFKSVVARLVPLEAPPGAPGQGSVS